MVESRDEIEILGDGQIFIVTEFLCHVTDVAFDFVLLREHVESEAGAPAGIGGKQPAEYANEGGLAATIGPEEAVDLAALNLQIDAIDDSFVAEAFHDATHVDDEFLGLAHG